MTALSTLLKDTGLGDNMSYYMKSGNTFRIATKESMDLHESLPAGNYVVKIDSFENFFIEQIEGFDVPTRMYGDTKKNTDRIINSFWNRDKSTGVMLVGEKGSGKTLLSKNICVELAKQSVPTIVINQPWHGDKFNTLIQSIQQPCVVMFDEFEKVYKPDEQEALLTLLDGIYSTKKLFMLTSNDKWRVDSHMRNRPGRIFYMIDFKGLDEAFIREYCYENLVKPELKTVDTVVNISSVFSAFNFDMLKALIEEMNRYGESPQDAMRILNVKAEFDSGSAYRVEIFKGDRTAARISPSTWNGTPLSAREISISWKFESKKKTESEFKTLLAVPDEEDEDGGWGEEDFAPDNLVKFNNKTGQFIFEKDGVTMILTKERPKYFNFDAF
jgi:ATPase family associated with various cellular activities (AAA)